MSTIVVQEFITLDGVVQGGGGPDVLINTYRRSSTG